MNILSKYLSAGALVVLEGCACGSGMPPASVYAAGHDTQIKAELAQAELAACKADDAKCGPVESDLKDIVETSKNLQKAAVDAGYKPEAGAK